MFTLDAVISKVKKAFPRLLIKFVGYNMQPKPYVLFDVPTVGQVPRGQRTLRPEDDLSTG